MEEYKSATDSVPSQKIAVAQSLLAGGRSNEADAIAESLLRKDQSDPRVWHLKSLIQAKRGELADAIRSIRNAINCSAGDIALTLQLGQYLVANGQRSEGLGVAAALEYTELPRAEWNDALGTLFALCDEPRRASKFFEAAVRQAPKDSRYQYNLAAVQRMIGAVTEAEITLNRVIDEQPSNGYAYYTRADLRTQTPECNHVSEMVVALENHVKHIADRILLCYALGKELDDIGDYRRAFRYFERGSEEQRRLFKYNVRDDINVIDRIIDVQTSEAIASTAGFDNDESIFVIGLPRTGTTLVEQVLSGHPQVFGAGELQAFPLAVIRAVNDLVGHPVGKLALVDLSLKVPPARLGRYYIDATRPQTGNTRFFVDKQPTNYLYAGLIRRALPRARFIFIVRDPIDSCFAMYRTLFTSAYPFSYTFSELATYFAAWHKLVGHWQATLGDRLLIVRYEDLVGNFEDTTRRMMAHCGLDWDNRVLGFHETGRAVTSASAMQVRRPIYQTSVGKWRHYENDLVPLIKALKQLEPVGGW